jgi:hypothetical protein
VWNAGREKTLSIKKNTRKTLMLSDVHSQQAFVRAGGAGKEVRYPSRRQPASMPPAAWILRGRFMTILRRKEIEDQ